MIGIKEFKPLMCQCERCGRFTDRESYIQFQDETIQLCENCSYDYAFFDRYAWMTIEKGNKKLILIY